MVYKRINFKKNVLIIFFVITAFFAIPTIITLSVTGIVEENISDELINGRRIVVKYNYASKSVDVNRFIDMVLAARYSLSDNIEILKAESIMIRTDIYRIMGENMSIDSTQLGMKYYTEKQMKNEWKDNYENNYNLIADCTASTSGIVMSFNGQLINAMYTEVSSGFTQSGADILGNGYEYLISVDCSEDMTSTEYLAVTTFTYKDFVKKIKKSYEDAGLNEENPFKQIQIVSKTQDGYVLKLQVGNVVMTGGELAEILGINSANMVIEDMNGSIKFTTKGKGSGFGVSMYTANIMAEQGSTYDAILNRFYQGITFISE